VHVGDLIDHSANPFFASAAPGGHALITLALLSTSLAVRLPQLRELVLHADFTELSQLAAVQLPPQLKSFELWLHLPPVADKQDISLSDEESAALLQFTRHLAAAPPLKLLRSLPVSTSGLQCRPNRSACLPKLAR